jgi:hypothetical protein
MWKGFMNPVAGAVPAMPAMPAATPWAVPAVGAAPSINFFDPNALTQMLAPMMAPLAAPAQGGYGFPFPVAPVAAPAK